jgi:hypothetical protein
MTSDSHSIAAPEHCILQHRLFASFADPLFRRAESDGSPVMVVKLGDREAAIPLRSLQREFAIADDSDDGRMLGLIASRSISSLFCALATRFRPKSSAARRVGNRTWCTWKSPRHACNGNWWRG